MNRYQLEVAEFDRRHARVIRALSLVGAAAVVIAMLWAAGLPPIEWWQQTHKWFARSREQPTSAAFAAESQLPASSTASAVVAPMSTVPIFPEGDSAELATPRAIYLVSTTPGRNKNEGTAQIGTSPEHPQTYVGGAILANGARLTEIHVDHVVLRRDGAELKIFLSGDRNGSLSKRTRGSSELGMVGGPPPRPPEVIQLADDRLTDVIRSMPFYENDLFTGLQIFPGQKSHAFSQVGLRSGDVVVALDGAPIADAKSAIDMLRTLTEGAPMTVTVRRGGQTQSISVDGEIVAKAVAPADVLAQPGVVAGPAR